MISPDEWREFKHNEEVTKNLKIEFYITYEIYYSVVLHLT